MFVLAKKKIIKLPSTRITYVFNHQKKDDADLLSWHHNPYKYIII